MEWRKKMDLLYRGIKNGMNKNTFYDKCQKGRPLY